MRAALWLLAYLMTGCGTCGQVVRHQEQFGVTQTQAKSDGLPQVRIDVPATLVNRWFDEQIKAMPATGLELEGLSELQKVLGRVEVRPRRISADIKAGEDAHFDVDLDVFMNHRILFSVRFDIIAPVVLDAQAGTIDIHFRAAQLQALQPRLTQNARSNLTSSLMRIMPAILRPVFLRERVEGLVDTALKLFEEKGAPLIGKKLIQPMARFAHLQLKVPKLPIERVVVSADESRWSFGIYTKIPGPGIRPLVRRGQSEIIQVGFGADALARHINEAMTRGLLPARFDEKGRPTANGPYTIGFRWLGGTRPLGFHMWCTDGTHGCVHVRASSAVRPQLENGEIRLNLKDARIDEVIGEASSAFPLELMRIAGRSFDFSRKVSASTLLSLGGRAIDLRITQAIVSSDVFLFQLKAQTPAVK